MITQEELKKLLSYNSDNGVFTWIVKPGKNIIVGREAGCIVTPNGKNYRAIGLSRKVYLAHRLAWLYLYGNFPKDDIDHINGNGLDNRAVNLRSVTHAENNKNMRMPSNNTSGIVGVSWYKQKKKWQSYIKVNSKKIALGHFDSFFEAICARKSAEVAHGFHVNHGSARPL